MGLCQSISHDVVTLESEVKYLENKVKRCKSQLINYSRTSASINEELINNINQLAIINAKLEQEKSGLEKRLEGLSDSEMRKSQTVKCGTTTCSQLVKEQERLITENTNLRKLLIEAEVAEKKLAAMEKDETLCLAKMDKLQTMRMNDLQNIQQLNNEKQFLKTKINTLNNELRITRIGSEKYVQCEAQLSKVSKRLEEIDEAIPGEETVEQYVARKKEEFTKLSNDAGVMKENNEKTKAKLLRARQKYQISLRKRPR